MLSYTDDYLSKINSTCMVTLCIFILSFFVGCTPHKQYRPYANEKDCHEQIEILCDRLDNDNNCMKASANEFNSKNYNSPYSSQENGTIVTESNCAEECKKTFRNNCIEDSYFWKDYKIDDTEDFKDKYYSIGVVEFDDMGVRWSKHQYKTVLDKINTSQRSEDTVLLVFAHGWDNNAKIDNSNYDSIRDAIKILAEKNRPLHYVGLFIAWRGESKGVLPPLKSLVKPFTYKPRKNVAMHVSNGVKSLLYELKANMKTDEDESDGFRDHRFFIIGHSMGGLIIYHALDQILMDNLIGQSRLSTEEEWKKDKYRRRIEGKTQDKDKFADLIILINPAFEAADYFPFWKIQEDIFLVDGWRRPAMMILDSDCTRFIFGEGDCANDFIFSAGETVFDDHFLHQNRSWMQREMTSTHYTNIHNKAVGHYGDLLTHDLKITRTFGDDCCAEQKRDANITSKASNNYDYYKETGGYVCLEIKNKAAQNMCFDLRKRYEEKSRNQKFNARTMFPVIQADPEIIPDHGIDNVIWTMSFAMKYIQFFEEYDCYMDEKCRQRHFGGQNQ